MLLCHLQWHLCRLKLSTMPAIIRHDIYQGAAGANLDEQLAQPIAQRKDQ